MVNIAFFGIKGSGKTTLIRSIFGMPIDAECGDFTRPQKYIISGKDNGLDEPFDFFESNDFFNICDDIGINIYEMPDISNVANRSKYLNYIENFFCNFDIVVFVSDITTTMKTENEAELMAIIGKNLQNNRKKNIKTNFLAII